MCNSLYRQSIKGIAITTLIIFVSFLSACTSEDMTSPTISDIVVTPDPSYEEFFIQDPYSQISKYTLEVYNPDKDLYNFLFNAVSNMETSADITEFELTNREVMDTCSSLYEQAGFQLSYLSRVKWSKDYRTINFIYYDVAEALKETQSVFYAEMNHLLNNVAPQSFTSYQKFFLIYDYICKGTNYTDDINDQTTNSAFSLLVNGKGICNGYAQLAYYVLNYVGIPTEYISNTPHAWNIVELDGKRYHTDFTWGSAHGRNSYLSTALMNDVTRNEGLDRSGFGEPYILGFPRDNPKIPDPCNDDRYNIFENVYTAYATDIENGWIYFSDYNGTFRVDLDGSNLIEVSSTPLEYLATSQGVLYYIGTNPNELYKLAPGEQPVLLDSSFDIYRIQLIDGVLTYGGESEELEKRIDLNDYKYKDLDYKISSTIAIPRHKSFSINITFDQEMDIDSTPTSLIGMVTESGETVPINMIWGKNKKSLTIRSKVNISNEESVNIYISSGLSAADGQLTKDSYIVSVDLE